MRVANIRNKKVKVNTFLMNSCPFRHKVIHSPNCTASRLALPNRKRSPRVAPGEHCEPGGSVIERILEPRSGDLPISPRGQGRHYVAQLLGRFAISPGSFVTRGYPRRATLEGPFGAGEASRHPHTLIAPSKPGLKPAPHSFPQFRIQNSEFRIPPDLNPS
jgi:hypothetical protein